MTIERREDLKWDAYIGPRDELIAAGLAKPEQFPGQPGLNATSATFYKGVLVPKHQRGNPWDEGTLSVRLYGAYRFRVLVGVPVEVQQRRQAAQNAAWQAQNAAWQAQNAAREAEEEQAVQACRTAMQAYRMAIVDSLKATAGRRRDQRYCEFLLDAIFCGAVLKEGPRRGGMEA